MTRLPDARDRGTVTELLSAWSAGDPEAFDGVMPLVYDELHEYPWPSYSAMALSNLRVVTPS